MSDDTGELEILKQVVGELRALNERIAFVEHENHDLRKAISNPDALLQKAGWLRVSTPHAAEIFDPLNRAGADEMRLDTPFDGSGEIFTKSKSRYDELQEWIDAEEAAKQ
jgi:hypothetical protein